MHIVYRINLNREELPNSYIGSKSNCSIINGKIIDQRGKEYVGSSTYPNYLEIMQSGIEYYVEILFEGSDYNEIIKTEANIQRQMDVVVDPKFFNLSIAGESTFANPEYATMRHVLTGKVARIQKNHPKIISGEWVGLTRGRIMSDVERRSKAMVGEENPFFGRKHSEKSKHLMASNTDGKTSWNKRTDESKKKWFNAAKRPKTDQHKQKIGRKNLVMLQNIHTKEIIRVPKTDIRYCDIEWVNPKKITPEKRYACIVCGIETTNGNIKRWHNERCKLKKD